MGATNNNKSQQGWVKRGVDLIKGLVFDATTVLIIALTHITDNGYGTGDVSLTITNNMNDNDYTVSMLYKLVVFTGTNQDNPSIEYNTEDIVTYGNGTDKKTQIIVMRNDITGDFKTNKVKVGEIETPEFQGTHLWNRLGWGKKENLEMVRSEYCVVWEDPNEPDEPRKVTHPDPNWMLRVRYKVEFYHQYLLTGNSKKMRTRLVLSNTQEGQNYYIT